MELEAIYENGCLKLEQSIPFHEGERLRITIYPARGRARASAGILRWTRSLEELDAFLDADNQPWAQE